ncbi:hypothetical protein RF11_14511 [Thelohanellus kitauei]|uniref:Uncharacterized protein n=1 Tax=Thelohanellus kitauei TaxID=669202 RepID=A0A0C2J3K0_THEKT|nr:hypothetical protein RF11_14511 [Thelohanellus kitauei]
MNNTIEAEMQESKFEITITQLLIQFENSIDICDYPLKYNPNYIIISANYNSFDLIYPCGSVNLTNTYQSITINSTKSADTAFRNPSNIKAAKRLSNTYELEPTTQPLSPISGNEDR